MFHMRLTITMNLSFSWGVPLVITIAALALSKIGYDASEVSVGWCWVRIHASNRVLWMLLTGKIWEFMAYLMLPVIYILIKRHIYSVVRRNQSFYNVHALSCVHCMVNGYMRNGFIAILAYRYFLTAILIWTIGLSQSDIS